MSNRVTRVWSQYAGEQSVYVSKGGGEPFFIIDGAALELLDCRKAQSYLYDCDWTDRGSLGWVTPRLRCDDFMREDLKWPKDMTGIVPPPSLGGSRRCLNATVQGQHTSVLPL